MISRVSKEFTGHPLLFVHEAAKIAPNKLSLAVGSRSYTFQEASNAILSLAEYLRSSGVSRGQVVAIDFPPDIDFLAKHALFLIGAASCSVFGFQQVPGGLEYDWLVSVPGKHTESSNTLILPEGSVSPTSALKLDDFDLDSLADDQTVLLILTSGTTGSFKPVALTNKQISARVSAYQGQLNLHLSRLSLIYNSGVGLFVQLAQFTKLEAALFADGGSDAVMKIIEIHKPRTLVLSPLQLSALLDHPRASNYLCYIEEFVITGAHVSPRLIARVSLVSPGSSVRVSYGSNETGIVAQYVRGSSDNFELVGPPVPGAEIEIVDAKGEVVRAGEIGIVRTKTLYMASQYHNEIIETAKAFRQGWFYPGDLGFLDDQGYLHLSGRDSDVINAGGVKINPRQLEERVLSLEGISDCAGVEVIDPSGVSAFGLAVVGSENIDLMRLEKLLKSYFPFSYPTVYRQLDELPKNRNGKADISAIKASFEEGK